MHKKHIIVFCTAPTSESAEEIAKHLVNKKFAACCSIIPGIKSVYRWQDKVESSAELLLMIKSTEENYKQIENVIIQKHPYEIPEIISVEIGKGFDNYLKWINQTTKVSYGQ